MIQQLKTKIPLLCSPQWTFNNFNKLVFVDASWYMPNSQRNGKLEFLNKRIENSRFFDIDECSDKSLPYPHMLPGEKQFKEYMDKLNINKEDHIVIYDGTGIFSSCRVFWTFKIFGHDKVSILNGGLPRWQQEGYKTVNNNPIYDEQFKEYLMPQINTDLIKNYQQIVKYINNDPINPVLDARPKSRFDGTNPEPRAGLSSGHMPNSISLSFDKLLVNTNGHTKFNNKKELKTIFNNLNLNLNQPIITSCGSGVTASILFFGLKYAQFLNEDEIIDDLPDVDVAVYDGSWSEYASIKESKIIK